MSTAKSVVAVARADRPRARARRSPVIEVNAKLALGCERRSSETTGPYKKHILDARALAR